MPDEKLLARVALNYVVVDGVSYVNVDDLMRMIRTVAEHETVEVRARMHSLALTLIPPKDTGVPTVERVTLSMRK